jgi:hypothetical protein
LLFITIKEYIVIPSVAEPHQFYSAPAPGENFDAAPAPAAPAPAPTLLYIRPKFLKGIKVNIKSDILFYSFSV